MRLHRPQARIGGWPAGFTGANVHLLLEEDPHVLADPDHAFPVQCSPFSLDQDAPASAVDDPHSARFNVPVQRV